MSNNAYERLQPPIPVRFRVPPLVQPQWRPKDLLAGLAPDIGARLSRELCAQYGVKHCILLDRARSGLYLLIKGMELKGEWVSTSLMHRPTTVLLRHHAEAIALADVKTDFTMDVDSAAAAISPRTEALLVTHMYGKSADVQRIRSLADRHGLFMVENAVHVPGAMRVKNKPLGSWGDAALLSFNVDKPLGGILGGALLTDRDDVFEAVSQIGLGDPNGKETTDRIIKTYLAYRWKPLTVRFSGGRFVRAMDGVKAIEEFSISSYRQYSARKIHRLQAAVAFGCLQRLPEISKRRMENAAWLAKHLSGASGIELPVNNNEQPHSFLYFPVLFQGDRYRIGEKLADVGIETKWRYYPIHLQEGFRDLQHHGLFCTEDVWRRHLVLPCGPNMAPTHLKYMVEQMRSVLEELST